MAEAFSKAELRLITVVVKHMQSNPQVDWEAVAAEYPYKSAGLARMKFSNIRTHCKRLTGETVSPEKASTGSKTSTPSKKRKAADDSHGITDGESSSKTPRTSPSKSKAGKSVIKEEALIKHEDEGEEIIMYPDEADDA